jgi:probable HAF family extracellular repeat protein
MDAVMFPPFLRGTAMQKYLHRTPTRALALALALAGCGDQITQPPVRLEPSDAMQADKAPFKTVLALDPLPGTAASGSRAYAINDLGQIVGSSSSSTWTHAVIWDNSTIPRDLGTLPGGNFSSPAAISGDGSVIAGSSNDGTNTNAVRWLKVNGQWLIDALPGGTGCNVTGMAPDATAISGTCTFGSSFAVVWLNGSRLVLGAGYANGVNGKGQAVGTNSTFDHALLWNFGTGVVTVTDLGTLGGTYAVANSINDVGEVTGWSENADHVSHAYVWSPKKNVMTDLGTPGTTSGGYGINAAGQVVGDAFPTSQHATLFDHGKVVDLGVLPGYWAGIALRINNNGQAVGWSYTTSFQERATMWVLK